MTNDSSIKPTDLRGILKYVPMFRGQIFVIAVDGSLVAHEMFRNVLLDIAVLRSLNIKIILVHGIGQQLHALAELRGIEISDAYGEGVTDEATLQLATEATASVNLQIVQGLTKNKLRCAATNAVRSKEIGILKGKDQQLSGNVDKLDISLIHQLLDNDTIPVVAPIAFNREGNSLRINSDLLAAELASSLEASKLIYLTTHDGLKLEENLVTNLLAAELEALLDDAATDSIPDRLRSKCTYGIKAIRAGTPRAHILDGRIFGVLLNEIFDKVGIGTMIYNNDYESIRPAIPADAYAIFNITRNAVQSDALLERTRQYIESEIENFLVYEIDGSIIGCIHLRTYGKGEIVEVGSVYVQPFYQKKGVGRRMIEYVCREARRKGTKRIVALTTQATKFFTAVCDFKEGGQEDLPAERAEEAKRSGRNSRVFYLDLQ
ncbi:MAG TPA: amino-acid N-acetyltransferase [Opitutales bacterium]|nr:amino-acid N-acetyltransferase [Opitutales bacterium]